MSAAKDAGAGSDVEAAVLNEYGTFLHLQVREVYERTREIGGWISKRWVR